MKRNFIQIEDIAVVEGFQPKAAPPKLCIPKRESQVSGQCVPAQRFQDFAGGSGLAVGNLDCNWRPKAGTRAITKL